MSSGPFTLAAWQHRHAFTYEGAAKALGLCRAAYARHLKLEREGKQLPKMLVMACKHIDQEAEKKGGDSCSNLGGGGEGYSKGAQGQQGVVKRCLDGRGYRVLD